MTYSRVGFQMIVPCDQDEIATNIAHARSLGLPPADADPIKTLRVVANGPSRWLYCATDNADTLALNGALEHFTSAGTYPTYWAACDPQPLVADFLTTHTEACANRNPHARLKGETPDCTCGGIDPPKETIYLVASKCHPSVFQRLQGYDVRVWDINDHPLTKDQPRAIPVASSITLVAIALMRDAFGYRRFKTYGWDACFYGNEHHAGQFLTDYPDNFIEVTVGAEHVPAPAIPTWLKERHKFPTVQDKYVGGQTYHTTTTWAAEGQDAGIQLNYATYDVEVLGTGLIRAIMESKG